MGEKSAFVAHFRFIYIDADHAFESFNVLQDVRDNLLIDTGGIVAGLQKVEQVFWLAQAHVDMVGGALQLGYRSFPPLMKQEVPDKDIADRGYAKQQQKCWYQYEQQGPLPKACGVKCHFYFFALV